jgi:hypothetical protein
MNENQIKTVVFFVVKKGLIKFTDAEDSFFITENVRAKSNFSDYPIVQGDKCEVSIEEVDNTEGVKEKMVTFLKKVKTEKSSTPANTKAPEEDAKPKEEKVKDSIVETVVKEVFCVSKYGLKFTGDNEWTNLAPELKDKDLVADGIVANTTVEAKLVNNKIAEIKIVKEASVESKKNEPAKTNKSSYSDGKSDSIEKQCASKNATEIIVALIEAKLIETKDIEKAISKFTKVCYKAIQEA